MTTRTERDSMGELQVPADALYQAQTQRAVQNFQLSGLTLPVRFIQALLHIKAAAAGANQQLGLLAATKADAIITAAKSQLQQTDLKHYPVDVFQTGSGTSSNMNVNEVLATLASQQLGEPVSPNDEVNLGQSSNDVIPTAIQLSAVLTLEQALLPKLAHLLTIVQQKERSIGHLVKTGRTHLMDAMPVTFGQVLSGWQSQLLHNREQLQHLLHSLRQLPQGGTAVGTGINAHPDFASRFCQQLSNELGYPFSPANNFFFGISSQDLSVTLSGQLKTLAVSLLKISNDLRWMNSGPLAGLAEIELPALQPGSSIMPGKVNPVVPEAVAMLCAQVIGNDSTITVAGQSGNFELNVMLPVIAYNLLQSIELLANGCQALADQAIAGFTVNEAHIQQALHRNPILITALNPVIGYMKAADIAKKAYQQQRPVLDVALEETDLTEKELKALLDPAKLCQGGIV
ncbi:MULTISPECIES: class II fumarate hydratase [Alkalimonas]|uniref:Fumarate hydratase class II n=1 Tax=Alkalimonas mucilaginosa TaxID=3057676 RepID=A0ABU7JBQ1_9GAMM|nr:class II fumarate hydratase [Alkalimonas sp. MEB004]MEE2023079.1 class II fumarate hydratase [Alkalimonas sp. MEB004]